MIIKICGTSGSGKSTVMREAMERLAVRYGDSWQPHYVKGRRKPLYYSLSGVCVLGHYESPCGGCDTIGSARQVFQLIQQVQGSFQYVLCEGLLLSEDVKWSSQLGSLRAIFLTTPLDTCLNRIVTRRQTAGNDKKLNPNNTSNRVSVINRARLRLESIGVYCRRASSEQAARILLNWIGE